MKKTILIFIVFLEFLLGSLFLFNFYKKINHSTNITVIKKETIKENPKQELKYYWTLQTGEWTENPKHIVPYTITYKINDDGLRENKNYQVQKPKKTFRIVTLGDSFTYGLHVNLEDIWPKVLEKKFLTQNYDCDIENIEVINLGVSGFDVQYIAQRYKDLGKKYDPNLVLWFESGTGFDRNVELTTALTNKCIKERTEEEIIKDKKEYDEYSNCLVKAYNKVNEDYSLNQLFNFAKEGYSNYFSENTKKNTIIFYTTFTEQRFSSQILDLKNTYPNTPMLPLVEELDKSKLLPDDHPTIQGHKIIAESIFDYLNTKDILCK
jgi:lysophospholipase L1-like esterase